MAINPLAGKPAPKKCSIDVAQLEREYYARKPDMSDPTQRVQFGTSGHRGTSLNGTFTEAHILAITQAICEYRHGQRHRRPAFHGQGHPRAVRPGPAHRPGSAGRQRRADRHPARRWLHADAGDFARHSRVQPRPQGSSRPTASSSRRRTIRRTTAASSTTRPTAARPTPTSQSGSRTAPTSCLRDEQRRREALAVRHAP